MNTLKAHEEYCKEIFQEGSEASRHGIFLEQRVIDAGKRGRGLRNLVYKGFPRPCR